jgi:hypothetical protein
MGNFVDVPSFYRKLKRSRSKIDRTSESTQSNSSDPENYHVYYDPSPDPDSSIWVNIKNRRKHIPETNRIQTTRYNILTFLPKNLFEQFHRIANVYFAVLIGLNWIPVINAVSKTVNFNNIHLSRILLSKFNLGCFYTIDSYFSYHWCKRSCRRFKTMEK